MADSPLVPIAAAVAALSPLGVKMIDTLKECGMPFLAPLHANAEAQAAVVHAKGQAEAALIKANAREEILDLQQRATMARDLRDARRQQNWEAIVGQALMIEKPVESEEKVDPDWLVQFQDLAQDVSSEEMRLFWARILAGEVAQPGSFSFRTVQTVKLLTRREANTFQILAGFLVGFDDAKAFPALRATKDFLTEAGCPHFSMLQLEAAGLISLGGDTVAYLDKVSHIKYGDRIFTITAPPNSTLEAFPLTGIGLELLELCDCSFSEEYFRIVTGYLQQYVGAKLEPCSTPSIEPQAPETT